MALFLVRPPVISTMILLALATAGCGEGGSPTGGNGGNGGGGGGGGGGGPEATDEVTIQPNSFSPAAIVVAPGTVVTWTWSSTLVHTVSFTSSLIQDSGEQAGGNYSTAMPQATGTYGYVCDVHGFTGSVTVQ
ncbi:MAG: plastocyanin/azurin family copper-binding protein [Gemmatimonadota bacterium]